MSSVTFNTSVGGDGTTVTDDSNPTTGLAAGGHRYRFVPALSNVVAIASFIVARAQDALASATSALASANTALIYSNASSASSTSASQAKTAAETARDAAQVYASQAQATDPDRPMTLNQSIIRANFSIASNYNAVSAGPMVIAQGISVVISKNANWRII